MAKRNIDEARVYFARVGTDLLTPTDEAVREIQNKLLGVMTNKLLHTDMPCSPPWKMCSSKGRPYSIITGLMAGTNLSYRLCQMNRGGMWGRAGVVDEVQLRGAVLGDFRRIGVVELLVLLNGVGVVPGGVGDDPALGWMSSEVRPRRSARAGRERSSKAGPR